MNVEVAAASLVMIYADYLGDVTVTSRQFRGFEMTIVQAAEQISINLLLSLKLELLPFVGAGLYLSFSGYPR